MDQTPIPIELRHLRYFVAVVEELHFTRAAERLHLSQPPLSQAVRALERELGVQLLRRTSRVVTPTEAGRIFADEARKVLALVDLAVAEARRAGGAQSHLRVGCVPDMPIDRLHRFLGGLRERIPGSRTQVTHLLRREQVRRLRNHELDLGILPDAGKRDEIETRPLCPGDPLAVVLPPDHPLAARARVAPDDLRDETLVTFPRAADPALYDRLIAHAAQAGYRFARVWEAGGSEPRDRIVAVACGLGVALEPPTLGLDAGAGDVVVHRPLALPLSLPDTVVAWGADPPRQLAMVLAAVRDVARRMGDADREQRPRVRPRFGGRALRTGDGGAAVPAGGRRQAMRAT
jgi:DNA-binding transcriptional LysR family regulator